MQPTRTIAILLLLLSFNAAHASQNQTLKPRIDMERLKELQRSVDEGHQPWRLDAASVACSEIAFPDDSKTCFRDSRVEYPSDIEAIVTFAATSNEYVVFLQRLVKPRGIWTATRIDIRPTARAEDTGWLHYEPEIVMLRGRLTTIVKYGPPGYGEHPESDNVEHPIILMLPRPVRVQGDPGSQLNSETFTNIIQVQLVIDTSVAPGYSRYFDHDVEVTGTLFRAHTRHHHSDVLMTVQALAPIARR